MKDFAKFEAFKLNKVQMNAIAGGATCTVDFGDGYSHTVTNDKMSAKEIKASLEKSYGEFATITC